MINKGMNPFKSPNTEPQQIKNIIMMGDSLSDRGTMYKSVAFGCIPLSGSTGLKGKSPDERFTNGLVWSDHVSAKIASDFTIKRLEKRKHLDHTDIADAVIAHDRKVINAVRNDYFLDDDRFINYKGRLWVRSYCIGGLMAHSYKWALSTSIVRFFTRLVVSSLSEMREAILDYDKKHRISYQHKAETLVIEWSGANDLVTVNAKPSLEEVDKAIIARMNNIKKLIEVGYRNFIVINLPNLALTPRFQSKSQAKRDEAQQCTEYFNSELQKACEDLMQDYPYCSVDAFDMNAMFEKIYHNPERYFFDKDKLQTPYTTSVDFNDPLDGISQARGYLFYDDLHPSADAHALLASYFYDKLALKYELIEPDKTCKNKRKELSKEVLLKCFRTHYERQLNKERNGFFGHKKPNLKYKESDLETIIKNALDESSGSAYTVLKKLGWINEKGRLILNEPALIEAIQYAQGECSSGCATSLIG
ncbi:SGNH/GDSL hydrolase family protein [Legionella worsleiensis]|uniref:Putative thermolabile hemolysin n=1 Tax=Legionella worsleiensis TaxID=45076 RepID=A0A0W1ALD2_9GAMM|nr:SGNH/GDSL hydrolase family protein [Legionella worsleiensis]KTD82118.1 putative thermolabile hemolysin [Legionella worsleiensis]STY31431.1 thermolabile hemolysin [Legionella worsleiensis]